MLHTEYINSFQHNFLKIKLKKQEGMRPRYQYQIITTKKLEGFLPVSVYTANGQRSLYYDISSMQSLSKWFLREKINRRWMDNLADCLQIVLWSLKEYLLDARNILLRPDCIFHDMESGKLKFLYYPYYIEEEKSSMEEFLSFLVEHVDEAEEDTMSAVYDLYAKWELMQEQFDLKTLLLLWEKHTKENTVQNIYEEAAPESAPVTEALPVQDAEPVHKKDFTGFFGKYLHPRTAEPQLQMAMESWEYQADREPQRQEPPEERTTYMEVVPEAEERKLYGNGRQNRKVISLDKLPLVIGKKGEMTDVILSDSSISRMHARLTEENGQIYLEDLNATNGTFKNGVRLKPYEKVEILREDEVKFGKLAFTYR